MFQELVRLSQRPDAFSAYSAAAMWADPHISGRMLAAHLDSDSGLASRKGAFVDESIEWVAARFGVGEKMRILDLGCGPGLYANRLAQLGASVTGIDISPKSIEHGERVADDHDLPASYICSDYLDFRPDSTFDLVIMIFCDFCALGPAQRSSMLTSVSAALAEGGSFLFDVHSRADLEDQQEFALCGPDLMSGFWSPEPYFGFHHRFVYRETNATLDKYDIVSETGTSTYYNWLQCFDPPDLGSELEAAGLEIQELLGDVAGADRKSVV